MAANIHIEGSSRMSREEFLAALAAYPKAKERTQEQIAEYLIVRGHRCEASFLREWAAHKLCYNLHILRSHTESVDMNYPQLFVVRVAYFVVGGVALLFY